MLWVIRILYFSLPATALMGDGLRAILRLERNKVSVALCQAFLRRPRDDKSYLYCVLG